MPIQVTTTVRFKFLSLAASSMFIVHAAYTQAPDNSANNKQPGITAEGQSNSASDLAITRKIRKAVVADKSLSTYALNIKIITANGTVTLKGPVKSAEEKLKIGSKAGEVVDASKIDNQLEVKAD
jgi:osmotically-inducible protein OsmY